MGVSDFAKKKADEALAKANARLRSSETAAKAAQMDDWLTQQRMSRKLGKETFRGTQLVVYRGYAHQDTARILVRVSESPVIPESSSLPYWAVIKANVHRHWTLPLAGVTVEVTVAGVTDTAVTDRHGFAAVTLSVPALTDGWHQVSARTVPTKDDIVEEVTATGRVLHASAEAAFAVISDIDDTVIQSGLAEGITSVRRTLVGDEHTRTSIPGMSSLYRGMVRAGTRGGSEPGFFYVSTGSWSFYEMLVQFLQIRGFPRGPLFLTDWGPTDRYLHRSGELHKKHTIERIMAAYPATPFVFVGDTGQGDYDAYLGAARVDPARVAMIILVPAGNEERIAELTERADLDRQAGIPVHVVADAAEAAQLLAAAGLCDDLGVEDVATELGAVF